MLFNDVAYAMGSTGGGGDMGSPLSMNILLMVVIFAIFYFLIIRPQSKEARRLKSMLANLKRGDRVVTVGGIYGEVVEIRGDVVLLDLGDTVIEVGLKYVANLAEGRPAAAAAKGKRRPAPRRSGAKATADKQKDAEEEVIDAELADEEPVDEFGPEDGAFDAQDDQADEDAEKK